MKSQFVSLPPLPPEEEKRLRELKDRLKYKILEINVKIGDTVTIGQVLASFGVYYMRTTAEVRVWTDKIKSSHNGTVKRVSVTKSCRVRPGQSLMVLSFCPHEMEFNGLCAICGADLSEEGVEHKNSLKSTTSARRVSASSSSSSKHVLFGSQRGGQRKVVSLRGSALQRLSASNTLHLESRRKLALVLDIDHTFLHSTRDAQAKLVKEDPLFAHSTHSFVLDGHRMPYFIKIRPGFRQFLLDVAGAFDIHLYTMSMRKYAEEIVAWIEGQGHGLGKSEYKSLIQNLVTRDDVPSSKKLLHRLFPCDEGMALIIDDRIDVWPDSMQNVLQIHKYLFWPNSEDGAVHHNVQNQKGTEQAVESGLGRIEIVFARKLKAKRRNEVVPSLKRFVVSFFANLGCYAVAVERTQCLVLSHRSPDDKQLQRFSVAVEAAIGRVQRELIANNGTTDGGNVDTALLVLTECKIRYKLNREELRRREGDRVLPCLSAVLLRLHREYYRRYDAMKKKKEKTASSSKSTKSPSPSPSPPDARALRPDARVILKEQKRAVFDGLCFVFSGLWSLDIRPQTQSPWKRALEFGAKCSETLSMENREGVTHCIAASMGSAKTAIAKTLGLELVHPNWLHNSTTHYMRSDPAIYRPNGWKSDEIGTETETHSLSQTELGIDVDVDSEQNGMDHIGDQSLSMMASGSSIKSILRKRKRIQNGNGFDAMPSLKRPKTVRFQINGDNHDAAKLDDDDDIKSTAISDVDPETKMMASLTDFVEHFNQKKELIAGAMERDIVMTPKEATDSNDEDQDESTETEIEPEPDPEPDPESEHQSDAEHTELDQTETENESDNDDDDEPFDFEQIEQDIDDAVNRIEQNEREQEMVATPFVADTKEDQNAFSIKDTFYDQQQSNVMHSDLSVNGDGPHHDHKMNHDLNELLQLEQEEQEEVDLESLLDDELESLSS